jgi:hypothetical protein
MKLIKDTSKDRTPTDCSPRLNMISLPLDRILVLMDKNESDLTELDSSQPFSQDIRLLVARVNFLDFDLIWFQMLPEPVVLDCIVF